VRVSGENQG